MERFSAEKKNKKRTDYLEKAENEGVKKLIDTRVDNTYRLPPP